MLNITKTLLSTVITAFLTLICFSLTAQTPEMFISGTEIKIGEETYNGTEINFPFQYGTWSPRQTLYNNNGTVITAIFKLAMSSSNRSEVKNSGLRILAEYTVEYNGDRRVKKTEQIKYLDAERRFSTNESFTVKISKYEVKVIRLSYTALLR